MVGEDGGGSNQTNQPVVGNYCSASGRIIMVLAGMEPPPHSLLWSQTNQRQRENHQGFHNLQKVPIFRKYVKVEVGLVSKTAQEVDFPI
jgi:hypothetical protein